MDKNSKSLYEYFVELPVGQWAYYDRISNGIYENRNPFETCERGDFIRFIENFFQKAGKSKVFEYSDIQVDELRYPYHICSVFFLGILLTNKIPFLSEKFKYKPYEAGYYLFPFLWFLITLFHDNAYQVEKDEKLHLEIKGLEDVYAKYVIEHRLFEKKNSKYKSISIKRLLAIRNNYFTFRLKHKKCIDHGLLGGVLLYDKLVKIRRIKKVENTDNLFWGSKLEKQYQLAAEAISLHNIWLQEEKECEEYDLHDIHKESFKAIKCENFPLFYLLGCVDTLEPLKAYSKNKEIDAVSIKAILDNILIEFGENYIIVIEKEVNPFSILKKVCVSRYFKNWLKVDIIDLSEGTPSYKIVFH